jgi:TonB family protein
MRFLPLFMVPALLAVAGCAGLGGPRESLLQGKYATGSPRYRIAYDSQNRKHGVERWWHENGALKSEASWRAGVRDGAYRAWYPDGTPWYQGRDSLGVPVDTLRFWHPNGRPRSLSLFARGVPVRLDVFDSSGLTAEEARVRRAEEEARALVRAEAAEAHEARRRADSAEGVEAPRRRALREWTARVRTSVETYWNVPESMKKQRHRAVARIRVAHTGVVLGVTWPEKSGSAAFDRRAARALARVKKFPPLPPELGPGPLDVRYAFTTTGKAPPRKKLRVREPEKAVE